MLGGRVCHCVTLWVVAISLLLLSGCSVYDNYDVDLMQDGFAAVSSSSDSLDKDLSSNNEPVASSSSDKKAKPSSSVSAENRSSNSEKDPVSSSSESSSGVKSSASSVSSASSSGSSASAEPLSSSAESVTSSSSDESASLSSSDGPAASSSSSAKSSSSSAKSSTSSRPSSSSALTDWVCGNSTVKSRDYEYKTVQVGNTCWFKENVHYVPSRGKTTCYEEKTSNCDKYGPLYNYAAASMACPVGWKLPSKTEVDELLEAAGSKPGLHLKSTDDWENGVGDDLLGMSILPAGCGLDAGTGDMLYNFQGTSALFWSSEVPDDGTENAHKIIFLVGSDNSVAMEAQDDNVYYVSVRCVKE